MYRTLWIMCIACLVAVLLSACSSPPKERQTPLDMSNVLSDDAPCWIRNPECLAKAGEEDAVYFVGRSETAQANWGAPHRDSFYSAQRDAEGQYARFLGVDISSSVFMQELLNNQEYQSQFQQTTTEDLRHRLSDIKKVDEYYVAMHETTDGEPYWLVFMLIKVNAEQVEKHRLAATEEAQKRELDAEWVAIINNVDDTATVYVNDIKISQCDLTQTCKIAITPHLAIGKNRIRLEFENLALLWAYGYQILRNNEIMYQGKCGQIWLYGCKNDTAIGVVHEFEFDIVKPRQE